MESGRFDSRVDQSMHMGGTGLNFDKKEVKILICKKSDGIKILSQEIFYSIKFLRQSVTFNRE